MPAKRQASLGSFFKFKNCNLQTGGTEPIDILGDEVTPREVADLPATTNLQVTPKEVADLPGTANLQAGNQPAARASLTGIDDDDDEDWTPHKEPWELALEQGSRCAQPACSVLQVPASSPAPNPKAQPGVDQVASGPLFSRSQSSTSAPAAIPSVPVVTLFLQRKYAEAILAGIKVWEGRPSSSKGVARAKAGDCVHFRVGRQKGALIVSAVVAEIRTFSSLRDMLRDVSVSALLPNGPRDVESAAAIYEAFGESYRNGGYVAWRLTNVSRVPEVGIDVADTAPPYKRARR